MSERVLSGAPASPGLAIGHARVLSHPSEGPARDPLPTPEAEAEHARHALRQAAAELEQIAARLREQGRADDAEIVETGALMAADPVLEAAVDAAVRELGLPATAALLGATAEHAAAIAGTAGRRAGGPSRRRALAGAPRGPDRRRRAGER